MNRKNKRIVMGGMRLLLPLCLYAFLPLTVGAQRVLSLDSCRAMAMRSNKQMDVARVKQDVAKNIRKSMRTKYLPHVSALGTYMYTSEEVSLLNDNQKASLSGLGTNTVSTFNGAFGNELSTAMTNIGGVMGAISPTLQTALQGLQNKMGQNMGVLEQGLNAKGQEIVDALHTDTRNFWAGSIMAFQPVFMGGSIIALNKMADINEELACNSADARRQAVLYNVDMIYWQVVSLKHKKRLAESYLQVVKKLDSDVQKMITEGVATKSDGLSVSVKVNEAEMNVQKVNDGLTLCRMLLCQTIGLPTNELVTLVDEDRETLDVEMTLPQMTAEQAIDNRPELKMLSNTVDLSKQATTLLKAGNLPIVALMGGYTVSNPSLQNGFEKKFRGLWNVGVIMRVPLWNWGDVMYKVRASKGATAIASLELAEAREKIELQVNQTKFKVDEANRRLTMATSNVEKADENLRMANLGFSEGVITPATVMEAQTAWLQAKSGLIDAQIDVKMSKVDLQKSMGVLQ